MSNTLLEVVPVCATFPIVEAPLEEKFCLVINSAILQINNFPMRMQGQLLPELSEIAVLRTKNAVLHSLSVLALQVAETASKEVVFVVQAVAPALDVSRDEFCEQEFY